MLFGNCPVQPTQADNQMYRAKGSEVIRRLHLLLIRL